MPPPEKQGGTKRRVDPAFVEISLPMQAKCRQADFLSPL
jgi:hypothetical protein